LPGYLEQVFPDYLASMWAVRGRNHPAGVTADMLVAEVLVDEVFVTGVAREDGELLGRWFAVVEQALGGADELLREIFVDYVPPAVLMTDRRARWTQELAGPLLGARLDAVVSPSWRSQDGGFGPEYEDTLPVPLLVSGHVYRGEILLHSRRQRRDRTGGALTRPFARIPVRTAAYVIGSTAGQMLGALPRTLDEDPRHEVDEFMAFVDVADWIPFFAGSWTVDLQGSAESYAVSIWPIHKVDAGDAPINWWQGEKLSVPDWRDAADLGAALVTAFRTATVDGRTHGQ